MKYVDNVISGCDTEESARATEYCTTSRAIMKEAKFYLRSWSLNSQLLTAQDSQDKVVADYTDINVLGMKWNTLTDTCGVFMCDIIFDDVIGQYAHDNFGCCNRCCCKLFYDLRAGCTLLSF